MWWDVCMFAMPIWRYYIYNYIYKTFILANIVYYVHSPISLSTWGSLFGKEYFYTWKILVYLLGFKQRPFIRMLKINLYFSDTDVNTAKLLWACKQVCSQAFHKLWLHSMLEKSLMGSSHLLQGCPDNCYRPVLTGLLHSCNNLVLSWLYKGYLENL